MEAPLACAQEALAKGDISFVQEELTELLSAFRVNLDRNGKAYPQLGMAVLGSFVRALQAIEKRNQGEAIESPRTIEPEHNVALGSTLSAEGEEAQSHSNLRVRSRGQAVHRAAR